MAWEDIKKGVSDAWTATASEINPDAGLSTAEKGIKRVTQGHKGATEMFKPLVDTAPSSTNLWTGKRLNRGMMAAGGALAAGAFLSSRGGLGEQEYLMDDPGDKGAPLGRPGNAMSIKRTPAEPSVAPGILSGGRAPGRTNTKANDLGATGDMVFGMHNNRKGG